MTDQFLHHFPSAIVSNFQSAVAKVVSRPPPVANHVLTAADIEIPVVDLTNEMIRAAAVVGNAVHQQQLAGNSADAKGAALAAGAEQCAQAAYELARARVDGDAAAAAQAESVLVGYGTCDPRWGECVAEFAAHYTITTHSDVPYVRYQSPDDFVLRSQDPANPDSAPLLPAQCRIAIIGDWGTGEARANGLLRQVAALKPDVLIHMGDIYYSCTAAEANVFYKNLWQVFPDLPNRPRVFTLCGNHDMYSGGTPYYALLGRLGQPASFFCLRNNFWQLLAMDTGYNDFDPLKVGDTVTWVQDCDDGDTYSELDWHQHQLAATGADGKLLKTILLSHHQPFSRNAPIGKSSAVNANLIGQFGEFFPQVALWLWGHEHNQVIYKEFQGLAKGRCIGASAIPVDSHQDLYSVADEFLDADGQPKPGLPELLDGDGWKLTVDPKTNLWNLGYAVLSLDHDRGKMEYYQYNSSTDDSTRLYQEDL
jgi:hypothetical protein